MHASAVLRFGSTAAPKNATRADAYEGAPPLQSLPDIGVVVHVFDQTEAVGHEYRPKDCPHDAQFAKTHDRAEYTPEEMDGVLSQRLKLRSVAYSLACASLSLCSLRSPAL